MISLIDINNNKTDFEQCELVDNLQLCSQVNSSKLCFSEVLWDFTAIQFTFNSTPPINKIIYLLKNTNHFLPLFAFLALLGLGFSVLHTP